MSLVLLNGPILSPQSSERLTHTFIVNPAIQNVFRK